MADAAVADLTALAADLAHASKTGMFQAAQQVIQQGAQRVQAEAQSRAPVKSGRLRNSISVAYPTPLSARIGPHVDYAVYQEYGTGVRGEFPTKPYDIRPTKANGVLVFTVKGKKRFARVVHHPGIPARPFMRPAVEAALGEQMVKDMLEKGTLLITRGKQ